MIKITDINIAGVYFQGEHATRNTLMMTAGRMSGNIVSIGAGDYRHIKYDVVEGKVIEFDDKNGYGNNHPYDKITEADMMLGVIAFLEEWMVNRAKEVVTTIHQASR
tara:strand:+ start:1293 stop:1613 length:321 start_codon:yes stop_codon:yes gene_type:complete